MIYAGDGGGDGEGDYLGSSRKKKTRLISLNFKLHYMQNTFIRRESNDRLYFVSYFRLLFFFFFFFFLEFGVHEKPPKKIKLL